MAHRDPHGRFAAGNPGRPPGRGTGREARRRVRRDLETNPEAALDRLARNPALVVALMLHPPGKPRARLAAERDAPWARWDDWTTWRAGLGDPDDPDDPARICPDLALAGPSPRPGTDGRAPEPRQDLALSPSDQVRRQTPILPLRGESGGARSAPTDGVVQPHIRPPQVPTRLAASGVATPSPQGAGIGASVGPGPLRPSLT